MKRSAIIGLVCWLLGANYSIAQDLLHCGADEIRINTLKMHPEVAKAVVKREAELEKFTKEFSLNRSISANSDSPLYIIPVVFHVIHDFGTENISDDQILDGIRILNNTFRKRGADTADIIPAFKPVHADCQIEFRLATKDPQGNCHNGINRIASSLTRVGDHSVKNLIHWDPSKYLNIYVCIEAAGLAGHSIWPSDADTIPLWDGIVIAHSYVGSIGTSDPTRSVVLAHECGHYLNLHHIWGGNNVPGFYYYPCADPNKDCSIDDLVDDTPPTIGWQSCALSGASCGNTVDMVQNAMDYSYCNIMFTYGQRDRMHACLNSPIGHRNNLWQLQNLIETGVYPQTQELCEVQFSSDNKVICEGQSVSFINESFEGPFDSLQWTFSGGNPSTSNTNNPSVVYANPGTYDVSLKVYLGGSSNQLNKIGEISVLPATSQQAFPYIESFENVSNLNDAGWFGNSLDNENNFLISSNFGASDSSSVFITCSSSELTTKDELVGPAIDLTNATQINLSFKYAHAKRDSSNTDQLLLYMRKSCSSPWALRQNIQGDNLVTSAINQGEFVPGPSDWKQVSVSIPSSYFQPDFRFKFVYISRGGNHFYLDDINLDIGANVSNYKALEGATLFPNPASTELYLNFSMNDPQLFSLEILDVIGQKIRQTEKLHALTGLNSFPIQIADLKSGLFFVKIRFETDVVVMPFIKE
ncbi:MAG: T9SS type A sorting domain-containing protein [Bacteroidia bacterium]|nr:T9SS type A sorting domain-containing protein [Bacteroidia bacterium]